VGLTHYKDQSDREATYLGAKDSPKLFQAKPSSYHYWAIAM